jgi:hypothetical protein
MENRRLDPHEARPEEMLERALSGARSGLDGGIGQGIHRIVLKLAHSFNKGPAAAQPFSPSKVNAVFAEAFCCRHGSAVIG